MPTEELTIQEKVFNLYTELVNAKRDKKDAVRVHTENIKRIEDEIAEIMKDEEDEVVQAQLS